MVDRFLKRVLRGLPNAAARKADTALDLAFYRLANPDVAEAGIDPRRHFARHGADEGRVPSSAFSGHYVLSHETSRSLTGMTAERAYLDGSMHQRPRLVFVSHDASRTGAPAIILRLIEMFSACRDVECFTLLDQGGERLDEFQAVSHCHVMSRSRFDRDFSAADSDAEIAALFAPGGLFDGNRPVVAMVNSMESSGIARGLAKCGVPMVSLVHEFADYYTPERMAEMFAQSARMVFPSQIVNRVALQTPGVDPAKAMVRGQGLLDDRFGGLDRDSCRAQLRADLGLPPEALVVLNVGTQCIRKGIDLFAETAAYFAAAHPDRSDVHFVWFGARADDPDQAWHRADELIKGAGLEGRVHLMPSTSEIEKVFTGADLFFLSARADPFPCVVHEAMACGLAVLMFHEGAGSEELIVEGQNGMVVPMGDSAAAAAAIAQFHDSRANWAGRTDRIIAHIRDDWQFDTYFQDLRALLREVSGRADLASDPVQDTPARHVLFLQGAARDLDLLDREDVVARGVDRVVLFGGHCEEGVSRVTARLDALGLAWRIAQPVAQTDSARAALLHGLLRRVEAEQASVHVPEGVLDPARLALLKLSLTHLGQA